MNRILARLMLAVVAVFIAGYAGFQAWRALTVEYETMPAREYVVDETIKAKGIAIRRETLLSGRPDEDISYLYADGTHVSKGMAVAQRVADRSQITNRMKRDALVEELENLQTLSGAKDAPILQTDSISNRIYTDLDAIAAAAARGDLTVAGTLKYDILNQLNRRSITSDPDTDFSQRIETLQSRIDALGEEEDPENALVAPEPGYFTKAVDGLEDELTPESMEEMTVNEFVEQINAPATIGDSGVGKIITDHIWYFAAVVPAAEAGGLREGRRVELDFGLSDTPPFLARIHKIVTEDTGERVVLLFECDVMSEELSSLRAHKVDISLSEMSGYKFPLACKRYIGAQLGVYVLETTFIQFKPVEVLYENDKEGYVVFRQNFKMEWGEPGKESLVGLEPYDQVIIGGNGLRDGKVLKQ